MCGVCGCVMHVYGVYMCVVCVVYVCGGVWEYVWRVCVMDVQCRFVYGMYVYVGWVWCVCM